METCVTCPHCGKSVTVAVDVDARYPEKWDATKADHRNRDLAAERDAVVRRNMQSLAAQDGHGFGHADGGSTCDLGYHEFTLRQTPAGSGSVCVRCGIAEPE